MHAPYIKFRELFVFIRRERNLCDLRYSAKKKRGDAFGILIQNGSKRRGANASRCTHRRVARQLVSHIKPSYRRRFHLPRQ